MAYHTYLNFLQAYQHRANLFLQVVTQDYQERIIPEDLCPVQLRTPGRSFRNRIYQFIKTMENLPASTIRKEVFIPGRVKGRMWASLGNLRVVAHHQYTQAIHIPVQWLGHRDWDQTFKVWRLDRMDR